ncbi:ArnT family glycosyltransferase [Planctomycetota bacterium]
MVKRGRSSRGSKRGPQSKAAVGRRIDPPEMGGRTINGSFFSSRLGRAMVIGVILAAAAIPFWLGKYFEFNTPDPYDSSSYVYSAQRILQGAQFVTEEKPSAQIGTLIINMIGVKLFGYSEFGPKFLQGIFQAAALLLMFFAMRRLFGLLAAGVGVMVASVYLSAPVIAKFGNVKEQYMIACMIMTVSLLIFHQLGGRWWWAVLAGVFCIWAPMFKPTGLSVLGGVGLFVIVQGIFKHRKWKQTGLDILWIWIGIFLGLAPVCIWKKAVDARGMLLPHDYVWRTLTSVIGSAPGSASTPTESDSTQAGGPEKDSSAPDKPKKDKTISKPRKKSVYITQTRALSDLKQQFKVVIRFYRLLILPIALAVGALIARIVKMILSLMARRRGGVNKTKYDRFVLLLAVWWLLDMAFAWISPRSYDQYFLPLNASAAMLGGYLIALYHDKLSAKQNTAAWALVGGVGLVIMIIMCWHIFFGIAKSPHHGNPYPQKSKGYAQKLDEIAARKQSIERDIVPVWESIGREIRQRSTEADKIYVWGWYPGIYVQSQRISPTREAVYGNMHSDTPRAVGLHVRQIVRELRADPPKFIVDPQKKHYPYYDHPNFDLWPRGVGPDKKEVFLPAALTPAQIEQLNQWVEDQSFGMMTGQPPHPDHPNGPIPADRARRLAADERARHEEMYPLREFVMQNYQPIVPATASMFVFQRNEAVGR